MNIVAGQFIDNLLYLLLMALILEASVSAIFSIKLISPFFETDMGKTIRDLLILLIAFGLCAKIPGLKVFYKMKSGVPSSLNLVISALLLARFASWIHSWMEAIIQKSRQS